MLDRRGDLIVLFKSVRVKILACPLLLASCFLGCISHNRSLAVTYPPPFPTAGVIGLEHQVQTSCSMCVWSSCLRVELPPRVTSHHPRKRRLGRGRRRKLGNNIMPRVLMVNSEGGGIRGRNAGVVIVNGGGRDFRSGDGEQRMVIRELENGRPAAT